MANNINNDILNSFIGEEIIADSVKVSTKDTLDYYEDLMKKQEIIPKIQFMQSELTEGMFFYKGEVKVFLPVSEVYRTSKKSGTQYLNRKCLLRKYSCVVIDVDRKANVVTLSMLKAQDMVRPIMLKQINDALAKGKDMIVEARVVYIPDSEAKNAYLDIKGMGIHGKIMAADWGDMFIPDLNQVTKVDEVINVAIIGRQNDLKNGEPAYLCSRTKTLAANPWDSIEEKAPEGSNVILKCLSLADNSFVGKVEGLDEVNAFCYYPEKSITPMIKVGRRYKGYVSHCSKERKIFRCRITEELAN